MQITNAMQFAHDSGIIHRDLKPQNIMLDQNRGALSVKILDFGIAKITADRRRLTRTGEVVGSPIFMSPEQCQGKPYDHRSDIYALGIVLFKSITGRYPHHGSTLRDTFLMKTTKDCPRIEEYVAGYDGPQRLAKLIYKCLEIKPKKRFATMADVYMELRIIADESDIVVDSRQSLKNSGVHFQTKLVATEEEPPPEEDLEVQFSQSRKSHDKELVLTSGGMGKLLTLLLVFVISISVLAFAGYYYLNKANVDLGGAEPFTSGKKEQKQGSQSTKNSSEIKHTNFPAQGRKSLFKTIAAPEHANSDTLNNNDVKTTHTVEQIPRTHQSAQSVLENKLETLENKIQLKKPRSKNYSPSKDEEHDAWWKYRLKKEN